MISALKYFFTSLYLRVLLSEQEQETIVDVDGSILTGNECLKEAGEQVLMPSNPPPPLTGWKQVTDANFKDIAHSIPQVTSGKYYNLCFTFYIA